jgi:hypothetical protein
MWGFVHCLILCVLVEEQGLIFCALQVRAESCALLLDLLRRQLGEHHVGANQEPTTAPCGSQVQELLLGSLEVNQSSTDPGQLCTGDLDQVMRGRGFLRDESLDFGGQLPGVGVVSDAVRPQRRVHGADVGNLFLLVEHFQVIGDLTHGHSRDPGEMWDAHSVPLQCVLDTAFGGRARRALAGE